MGPKDTYLSRLAETLKKQIGWFEDEYDLLSHLHRRLGVMTDDTLGKVVGCCDDYRQLHVDKQVKSGRELLIAIAVQVIKIEISRQSQ